MTAKILSALRRQVNQLEATMVHGGPSEICGAIDSVELTLYELREAVSPQRPLTYGVRHGVDCRKVLHISSTRDPGGWLHDSDDDTPYDVDGCKYCGRCHQML